MWNVPEALGVLTGSSIEEALRFAYAVSELMPAGLVVGAASVLAGLLGAAAVRKTRVNQAPIVSRARVPWVLGVAILAAWVVARPSEAAVVCRKGESRHLVLRAGACGAREHAVDASEVGLARETTCVQDVASAWEDVGQLRAQIETARQIAEDIAAHPWPGADTWLVLQGAQIVDTLTRLDDTAAALGIEAAADPIARMRQTVRLDWSDAAAACSQVLAILPELEAALPVPAAG